MQIFRKEKAGNRRIFYLFDKKILSYHKRERERESSAARYFLPMHASHAEVNCFIKHIINSKSYLEFGCGGSTFLLAHLSCAKIMSIESDKNFIDFISQNETIAQNLSQNPPRLSFVHIDIGQTKEWGYPQDESKRHCYPLYSQQIFTLLTQSEIRAIDTYFVDGRFRVACVLNILLHCDENATIIIHDFWNREQYHIVLDFLQLVDRTETLGVFKPKSRFDKARVKNLLKEYEFVVD